MSNYSSESPAFYARGVVKNTATKAGAKFGIESLGEMGADISQQLAAGEAFSLSMVGISFGTSLLGNAGGEALSGAFGKLGTKLGVDQIDNAAFKTGGEFVTDTIGETATDVTGQVVFEDKELSWQTVGESAGTSAFGNLVGRGANRAYGDRLRNLGGGDRPSTDVPNLNQPLPPVGDISTPTPIIDPNTNQPVGQTPASTPIIDPNTNQPIGQTPPSTPTKDQGLTQIPSDQIKDTSRNPDLQQTLTAALPNDLQGKVAINVDPDLPSHTVRVHYDVDANGLVTNVHMRVGSDASAVDIQLHTQTVRLMQRYSGFSGRIRLLKERIQNWISKNGTPPVGSRAWEAKLEVEKLPRIIDERLNRLSQDGLDAEAEANLQADIENLQQQLAKHQQTLDEMDLNAGVGFVAAEGIHNVPNPDDASLLRSIKEDLSSGLDLGKPVDSGGFGTLYEIPGHPNLLIKVATLSEGQPNDQLIQEAENLSKLTEKGYPMVYKGLMTWVDSNGVTRQGIVMDKVKGALSKRILRTGKFADEPVDLSVEALVTPKTIEDLTEFRQKAKDDNLVIDDLQFMISEEDGSIHLIDPARIDEMPSRGKKRKQKQNAYLRRIDGMIKQFRQILTNNTQ
ncbi:MAG: hypothetical protein RID53_25865 [Coleofasciculus sp. B1-GNL1-01]|uniref:hypothetical protein n=1 Tax=Coleofasciculus sp. B1-GNL1-01 TaxID=3068484 RepID=UPI0032F94F14